MNDARVGNILTVCVGNVCRSPLAERLFLMRLADAGAAGRYAVSSAGVMAMTGRAMEPTAAKQLTARGGDPEGFVARQLTPSLVRDADLILTATVEVRGRVLEDVPGALRRAFTLREFAALVAEETQPGTFTDLISSAARRRSHTRGRDLDIVDPMGMGDEVHAEAADLIESAVDTIAPALARAGIASKG